MANSVSLDGSFVGFQPDVRQHFSIFRDCWRYMVLAGSRSIIQGTTPTNDPPVEEEADFIKPSKGPNVPYYEGPGIPYFVIPDSGGITRGLLHRLRRWDLCRDVIVLVSEKTGQDFLNYLEERHYDFLICGKEKVDLVRAMDWLVEKYAVDTIMVDGGPTLNRALLEQGLLDEIGLLVHPVLVGNSSNKLLSMVTDSMAGIRLDLIESREVKNGMVFVHYKVMKKG